jgi:excisionase family DNA binding protein
MNKAEACELLQISDRSLARYAAQGKVAVTYHKGRRGNVAEYDDDDVRALKVELSGPVGVRKPTIERLPNPDNTSLQSVSDFGNILQAISARMTPEQRPQVEVADKLLLTLKEASALSNLSNDYLRQAIKNNKLKAAIIGRGWKIKRAELERFIAKL